MGGVFFGMLGLVRNAVVRSKRERAGSENCAARSSEWPSWQPWQVLVSPLRREWSIESCAITIPFLSVPAMMMGVSQEQIGEMQEEIMKEAEERALENCKLRFIGLAIADEKEFTATDVEIDEEIANIAISQQRDASELRKELIENDSFEGVSDQIRFNKAMEYMLENAKIK